MRNGLGKEIEWRKWSIEGEGVGWIFALGYVGVVCGGSM